MLGRMSKDTRKQINLRVDAELDALIDDMRRQKKPIPSISELMRQALDLPVLAVAFYQMNQLPMFQDFS